jgi:hypothetical protein
MPIVTTGSFTKALWPGVNAWYGKTYNEFKPEYPALFTTHKSRKAFEEDVGYSGFGLAQIKGEGAGVAYDSMKQGFITRYAHVEYALGFVITRNAVEDDLYDVVGERKASSLAMSMRQTKETVAGNVFNRAFNSSYTGGDGKEMCATDHPNVAGGTWANELATAADISEAALEQVCIDLGKYTNDRGLKIAVRPTKLVIPTDLEFEAGKIMKTEYEVGTANNTVNLVRSKFPAGMAVNHYLTDTDAWFVLTDVQHGMKHFERRADDFASDNDFDTDNAKYKATARYSFGWTDPRGVFGSPGA